MDKTAFIILVIITALLGGGIIYFHTINNVPVEDLMGIDSNNNGVRNDVEDWINQNYSDPVERGALMQYAKRIQLQIASYQNPEESNSLRVSSDDSYINCAEYVFGAGGSYDITDKLRDVILNTPSRRAAYDQYNRNLTGGVFGLGEEPSINDCEFYADTMNDWPIYHDEQYGFEFKYPKGVLKPVQVEKKSNEITFNYWGELYNDYRTSFRISIAENNQGIDMFNWYKNNIDSELIIYKQHGVEVSWSPDVYWFNNKPIPKEYLDKYGSVTAMAYIMSPDKKYVLTISKGQESGLDSKNLDLLISSMKF